MERVVAGLAATLVGGATGVLLSRFVWVLAGARDTCDLGPGGHCPGPSGFLPFAVVGGALGAVAGILALVAVVRSLD